MNNKTYIIFCVSRFGFDEPFGVLTVGMTAKQKGRKKRLAVASPPLNAPFSHQGMLHAERSEISFSNPLQINNFTYLML